MKTYDGLTTGLVHEFGNRKEAGKLSLIVDLRDRSPQIYAVPRQIEHVDFVRDIFGLEDQYEVQTHGTLLVPTHVFIRPNGWMYQEEVTGYLTGISGLEIAFNVRHPKSALKKAHEEAKLFAQRGELRIAERLIEDKIIYRYASD
ncbi:MAG TPA: hypothetical protein VJJ82_03795 [Candidatus Nanoarchaeia archaeon]|nr:hypothetical protein [Candidatus Nanoarchaeia archaeon]